MVCKLFISDDVTEFPVKKKLIKRRQKPQDNAINIIIILKIILSSTDRISESEFTIIRIMKILNQEALSLYPSDVYTPLHTLYTPKHTPPEIRKFFVA